MKKVVAFTSILFGIGVLVGCAFQSSQMRSSAPEGGVLNGGKVYSNMGFQINIPEGWVVDRDYESRNVVLFRTNKRQADLEADLIGKLYDLEIRVYDHLEELPNNDVDKVPFKEWLAKKADSYGFIARSPVTVSGVSGVKGALAINGCSDFMEMFEYDGKVYQILLDGKTNNDVMSVVDSFKFVF